VHPEVAALLMQEVRCLLVTAAPGKDIRHASVTLQWCCS
jgi:hypothetical protein